MGILFNLLLFYDSSMKRLDTGIQFDIYIYCSLF